MENNVGIKTLKTTQRNMSILFQNKNVDKPAFIRTFQKKLKISPFNQPYLAKIK